MRQLDGCRVAPLARRAARKLADDAGLRLTRDVRDEVPRGRERLAAGEQDELLGDRGARENAEQRSVRLVVAAVIEPNVDDHATDGRRRRELGETSGDVVRGVGRDPVAEIDHPFALERRQPLRVLEAPQPDRVAVRRRRRECAADARRNTLGRLRIERRPRRRPRTRTRRGRPRRRRGRGAPPPSSTYSGRSQRRLDSLSCGTSGRTSSTTSSTGRPSIETRRLPTTSSAPTSGEGVQPAVEVVEPEREDMQRARVHVERVDRGVAVALARHRGQPHQADDELVAAHPRRVVGEVLDGAAEPLTVEVVEEVRVRAPAAGRQAGGRRARPATAPQASPLPHSRSPAGTARRGRVDACPQ